MNRIWVNLVASGQAVSGFSKPGREREYAAGGEVRTYGDGRQRSITTVGERGSFSFTLVVAVEDQITTLRSWQGQLVQVRDHRGRRFHGVFFGVGVGEYRGDPNLYTAEITLRFTTYTEGV